MKTCLYRCLSATDELLYVGITDNLADRMKQHRAKSPWFSLVSRVAHVELENRSAAKAAERKAVFSEKPKYNQRLRNDKVVRIRKPLNVTFSAEARAIALKLAAQDGKSVSAFLEDLVMLRNESIGGAA